MTPRTDAVADLAEDVGKALLTFAERLRAEQEPTAAETSSRSGTRASDPESSLGAAQRAVLEALREVGEKGLTSHAAAVAAKKSNTNTPRILTSLASRGLVTSSEEAPAVWRAVQKS